MIQLPMDSDGREIPLDTALLYGNVSGKEFEVVCFNFSPSTGQWTVELKRRGDLGTYATEGFTLSPPDSWEKLEEDIRRIGTDDCTWFCGYANENPVENACPDSCKFFNGDEITCRKKLADDILSRIRKLRGEDDA